MLQWKKEVSKKRKSTSHTLLYGGIGKGCLKQVKWTANDNEKWI
jgi:hypothetical protein